MISWPFIQIEEPPRRFGLPFPHVIRFNLKFPLNFGVVIAAVCLVAAAGKLCAGDANEKSLPPASQSSTSITSVAIVSPAGLWVLEYEWDGNHVRDEYRLKSDAAGTLSGVVYRNGSLLAKIQNARFDGQEVFFSIDGELQGDDWTVDYQGEVIGDAIEGTVLVKIGGQTWNLPWKPRRGPAPFLTAIVRPRETTQVATNLVTADGSIDYLLYLPEPAQKNAAIKWPTILFLHGMGQRGSNVWQLTQYGPPKIVEEQTNFPFIVIAPQCPANRNSWDAEALVALVQAVENKYPIDPDRLYLTGLSMGGTASWTLAGTRPDLFAAVAPVCGRSQGSEMEIRKLKSMPIWVFHGAKDPVVPLSNSEEMVRALRAAGNDVRFTVYPEADHESWTATYDNPELYQWFLQNHRPKQQPPNPLPK